MVLMGIILAASVPAVKKLGQTNDLVSSADQLAAHMRLARQKAVARGMAHILVWSEQAQLYAIVVDENGNGLPDVGEPRDGPFGLSSGVEMHNSPGQGFSTTAVVFQPVGSASETGTVNVAGLCGGLRNVTVLAPTGQVKVE
jgi:Tfp pilus assembly protein FimT